MTTRPATPPDTASRVWTALHESVTGQDRRACPPRRNRDPSRLTQEGPPMIRTLGTEFAHFFLLEQDGEVTLIDAGLSRYRDTLEPVLSVFDRRLRNPGLPVRQA